MSSPMNVSKVTLSGGKVVLLRELKIKHQELAAEACAQRGGDNKILLTLLMQKELLKLLIVQIDGQDVKPVALEQIDDLFTYLEYNQLLQVVHKIMGGDDPLGKFQVETVSFGGK